MSGHGPFAVSGVDPDTGEDAMLPKTKLGKPGALDFDAKTGSIFYCDVQGNSIEVVGVNETESRTLRRDVACEGLAYDWTSGNLYWTDLEKGEINVLKVSNSSVSVII